MGRRHGKGKKQEGGAGGAEGGGQQQPAYVQPADPPRATLAVHPQGAAIAVAVGPELRIYDARTKELKVLIADSDAQAESDQQLPAEEQQQGKQQPEQQQQQQGKKKQKLPVTPAPPAPPPIVRGVAFDANGRFLVAGSEDKAAGLRLWDCSSWELLQCIKVPKKVTTIAFTPDGKYMLAGDKFGDVLAAATERPAGLLANQQQEPEILLGHYCAIITSLSLSAGGRFVATTDRDQRVRVSIMPADPMAGAHEIQSYCLGHTSYVTCSVFVQQQGNTGQELLVTGGGDGTLRLWDPLTGQLLHTLELPPPPQLAVAEDEEGQQQEQQAGEGGSSGDSEEEEAATAAAAVGEEREGAAGGCCSGSGPSISDAAVPLALAASLDGSWIAMAVDGRDELCLVQMDWASRQLRECGWHALSGLHLPACLLFDCAGRLWAAGGPVADDSRAAFVACGTIQQQAGELAKVVDLALPDWLLAEAAQKLEAKAGNEAELLAAAVERRRLASGLLKKRKYSLKELEHRKRLRRDKVAAATAAEAATEAGRAGEEAQ